MEKSTTEKLTDISIKAYGMGCALSVLDDSLSGLKGESMPVCGALFQNRYDDYHNILDMMRTDLKGISDSLGDLVEEIEAVKKVSK
jgi:hypothetical protein